MTWLSTREQKRKILKRSTERNNQNPNTYYLLVVGEVIKKAKLLHKAPSICPFIKAKSLQKLLLTIPS